MKLKIKAHGKDVREFKGDDGKAFFSRSVLAVDENGVENWYSYYEGKWTTENIIGKPEGSVIDAEVVAKNGEGKWEGRVFYNIKPPKRNIYAEIDDIAVRLAKLEGGQSTIKKVESTETEDFTSPEQALKYNVRESDDAEDMEIPF